VPLPFVDESGVFPQPGKPWADGTRDKAPGERESLIRGVHEHDIIPRTILRTVLHNYATRIGHKTRTL
jgi:hypothetical protein